MSAGGTTLERRVLDAAKTCCEKWGVAKVTIDDIANESGVSRASLYRLFPGGKDVLFEALRLQELEDFFTRLSAHVEGADGLEDLLVCAVVAATAELRADRHLALMLASEPGETLGHLTVDGLPRIMRVATVFLAPFVDPYLPRRESAALVELLSRLVISYFLAPSQHVDLGDPESARTFIVTHILPAFDAALIRS
ncbi:MAG: TetR/AcrR family transcriptional regulator [Actinobacteria bacterium]|nr:TetR/AcrR family transcriptional regulator [Actinomycetota bacterium]